MIKLAEGGFADLWLGDKSPEVEAISYALQMAVIRVMAAAEKTKCYSDIEKLNDDTLDYFAVEMRTMYYNQSFPIDKKRAIIKNTLNWYTKGGTPSAVKELLDVAFGTGDLEEWFDYGGDPFHFAAVIPVSEGEAVGNMNLFRELIQKIKNERSHCDELILEERTALKLKTKDGAYRVCPPRCGTFPYVSTGFDQQITRIAAKTTDGPFGVDGIQTAQEQATGTHPKVSTGAALDAAQLALKTTDGGYAAAAPKPADAHNAGTKPGTSTGFSGEAADIALQTAQSQGTAPMPQSSDNLPAGTVPTTSTGGYVADGPDVTLASAEANATSRQPHAGTFSANEKGGPIK